MADLQRVRSIGVKLAKLTSVAAVFAAGISAHWLYMNGSATNNFVIAGLKAKFSAQEISIPHNRGDAVKPVRKAAKTPLVAQVAGGKDSFAPSWKGANTSDEAVLRKHLARLAQRKRLHLAVRTIDRSAGSVGMPSRPWFPLHVRQPGRHITLVSGPVAPPAAPHFSKELIDAGANSRLSRIIAIQANVLPPVVLNQEKIALAILRREARKARRTYSSMQRQLRRALKNERRRVARLSAERINLTVAVKPPPARLIVDRQYTKLAQPDAERLLVRLARSVLPPANVKIRVRPSAAARRIMLDTQQLGKVQRFSNRSMKSGTVLHRFTRPDQPGNALAAIKQSVRPQRRPDTLAPDFAVPVSELKLVAYAPLPKRTPATKVVLPIDPPVKADIALVKEAIGAYLKGDMAQGDAIQGRAKDKLSKLAMEWAALRLQPRKSGYRRISKFLSSHPDWPVRKWLQWRAEQALYVDRAAQKHVAGYLEKYEPQSVIGNVLLARKHLSKGNKKLAGELVRKVWYTKRFSKWLEGKIQKEFGALFTADDHLLRSNRQFYKGRYRASLRSAGRGGKAVYALAAARIVVARGGSPTKAGAKLTAKMRKDATWRYAQIRRLRRAKKIEAAAKLVLSGKVQPISGPGAKVWWEEHRSIARRLLDAGNQELAYKVAAHHPAIDGASFLDGEFYSGFIALRFLNKPNVARAHFSRALGKARTPISRSRAAYWQARAAEKTNEPEDAERLYALAAVHSSSYYGQLAGARRGRRSVPIRRSPVIASGDERLAATRVIDILKQAGAEKLALHLVVGSARTLTDRDQIAALAAILRRHKDARATLLLGKLSAHRGIELDTIAFPDFGVPQFTRLANSAEKPLVYAIARQESAFQAKAKSHAGAKGLMQMLTSTARRTAQRQGIPFDASRLLNDPAFNAQLGAAHLGELMRDHPGSLLLVFAAYNAGGGRVNQWIKAYGDPRKPGIDPIDWVERIPFSETRNYVQRVAENLSVYRSLFGRGDLPYLAVKDLRAFAARR